MTCDTAVGVILRSPSYNPRWADTRQQKNTAGAMTTIGQKLPGIPTKAG
mgnify:CR=1 FL=1